MRGTLQRVAAILLFALATHAPAGWAHQQFRSSSPAPGDTLQDAPRELRLTFAQAIPLGLAQLHLRGPSGEVPLGAFDETAAADGILLATIRGPLPAGSYTVEWLVTGDDGHAVRGSFAFHLPASAGGIALPASAAVDPVAERSPPPEAASPTAAQGTSFGPGSPLYWAVRWLNLLSVVTLIGAAAAGLLLVPGFRKRAGPTGDPVARLAERRVIGAGVAAVLVVAAAMALRLYAQALTLSDGGAVDAVIPALLRESRWGEGWLLQLVGVVAALLGLLLALRLRLGWALAMLGAIAVGASSALSGHAAALSVTAMAGHALHVVAAGGWLGTLLILMLAALPAAFRADPLGRNHPSRMLAAFSPLALLFAALLVLSGLFMASVHLPSLDALWTTGYGRVLSVKLVLLLGVLAAGAYNWRRARPRLEAHGDRRALRRAAVAELLFAAAVLAVTAALAATPPPAEAAGGEVVVSGIEAEG